jgi:hypothetical protein
LLTPSLAGNVVFAGDLLELSFRFPAGIRPDEWEAFLSLDGGKSYPVRLSGERTPDSTRLVARVPNLPTDAARILVRAGGEDEAEEGDRFEVDIAISDPFQITAGSGIPGRAPWPDAGRLPRRGDHVRIEWVVEASAAPEPGLDRALPDGFSERSTAVNTLIGSDLEATVTRGEEETDICPSRLDQAVRSVRRHGPTNGVKTFRSPIPPPLRI